MLVEEKYFDADKNYLLKNVQAFAKDYLLQQWTNITFDLYNQHQNPMGLQDDFILELRAKMNNATVLLDEAYNILAAAYRFYHGDNQLSFNWDGRSHMDRYDQEWKEKYVEWTQRLSSRPDFQRVIIKYVVTPSDVNTQFLSNTIKRGIMNEFGLKMKAKNLRKVSA